MSEPTIVRSTRGSRIAASAVLVLVAAIAAAPWWANSADLRLITEILFFLALASMWNLLAGYAGLISVGQHAYVGLGGYMMFSCVLFWGMNPLWSPGDLVLLDDHINLLGDNPLVGPNLDALGPRFPDMSEPYDRALQRLAQDVALRRGLPLRRGVYVAVVGPNLETRAEYRMLRALGADVVGMSTVPEVIVARHMGIRVLGLSIVTDACLPDALEPADVNTIIRTAMEAEPHLTGLVHDVIAHFADA